MSTEHGDVAEDILRAIEEASFQANEYSHAACAAVVALLVERGILAAAGGSGRGAHVEADGASDAAPLNRTSIPQRWTFEELTHAVPSFEQRFVVEEAFAAAVVRAEKAEAALAAAVEGDEAPRTVEQARAAGWEREHEERCPNCAHEFVVKSYVPSPSPATEGGEGA